MNFQLYVTTAWVEKETKLPLDLFTVHCVNNLNKVSSVKEILELNGCYLNRPKELARRARSLVDLQSTQSVRDAVMLMLKSQGFLKPALNAYGRNSSTKKPLGKSVQVENVCREIPIMTVFETKAETNSSSRSKQNSKETPESEEV